MRWKGRERSENVEDRRGMAPKIAMGGGGLIGILILVFALLTGGDPQKIQQIFGEIQQQQPAEGQSNDEAGKDDAAREFIEVVLKDTENVWTSIFRDEGIGEYQQPKLVMFSDQVRSACGIASSKVGPFYCPADQQVYIDPVFFEELSSRHNAAGDFAAAYVIAHEVAHHVQKLIGFSDKVNQVRAKGNQLESNRASVRLELQADYLAGVWAHHAQKKYQILEKGDIGEAINAANQIGDDTLQKQSIGYAIPERFTHGTSKQRVYWFKKGLETGKFRDCTVLFELPYDEL